MIAPLIQAFLVLVSFVFYSAFWLLWYLAYAPPGFRTLLVGSLALLAIAIIVRGFNYPHTGTQEAHRAVLIVLVLLLVSDLLGCLSMLIGPGLYSRLFFRPTFIAFLPAVPIGIIVGVFLTSTFPQPQPSLPTIITDSFRTLKFTLGAMVIIWVGTRRIVFESCFYLSPADASQCFAMAHAARALVGGLACGLLIWICKWTTTLNNRYDMDTVG
ncbi:MAG: hypothetical protein ACE5HK_02885 [Candidatus Methylomirabilales bacterium]